MAWQITLKLLWTKPGFAEAAYGDQGAASPAPRPRVGRTRPPSAANGELTTSCHVERLHEVSNEETEFRREESSD
jgi:hypothetical protein